ncbi:uncharacterized protein LOC125185119 isoform X2 [Salvia hispanica]|uniref:uncharacterized protein LOC125185119 isoform X2 n=1 Tax=Salvia hispanica TaxID=49212 RepID=UPI0020099079|nr:uncharacterized protein LOC125185119 isoform X2 [Salvia hispanica]
MIKLSILFYPFFRLKEIAWHCEDVEVVDVDHPRYPSCGNMTLRPSTPEIVCLQCGDVGFRNSFVYCVKCVKYAVHRQLNVTCYSFLFLFSYCLNVVPKSLNEFVRWLCDDCEAEVKNQRPHLKIYDTRNKTRNCSTSKHIQRDSGTGTKEKCIVVLTKEEPVSQSSDLCAKMDLVELSATDSDCHVAGLRMIDEAIVLSADESKRHEQSSSHSHKEENIEDNLVLSTLSADDTSRKDCSVEKRSASPVSDLRKGWDTLCSNTSDRPHNECTNVGFNERAKLASESTLSEDMKGITASLKRYYGLHRGSDVKTNPALSRFSSDSGSLGSSKKMKPDTPSAANLNGHKRKPLFAQRVKKHKGFDSGTPSACMTAERSINPTCDGFPKDSTILPPDDCQIRAEPVMEPIWSISNNQHEILEDIMAHMSLSACQKVYNEARQFIPLLHLEMLPRSHVWPQRFESSESSAGNIALYFFPSERSERFYDNLVDEMVEEDLALKAIVKNAELLVFPSTKLPLSHWRFQGKYYMWGVFREKQAREASRCPSSYSPVMHRDRVDENGVVAANFGGESPITPLSNCSSKF